jgi:poly-gamma-glutamate capsule biosynthesis protein CapA/YwtB (metallophosphatase superfamily)
LNKVHFLCIQIILLIALGGAGVTASLILKKNKITEAAKVTSDTTVGEVSPPKSETTTKKGIPVKEIASSNDNAADPITISAAGDVTIGTDETFSYQNRFDVELKKKGYDYFPQNIKGIFDKDDLTIVNLETTLTNAKAKAVKTFRFKGAPENAKILNIGNIEAVNIANNHIHDYLQKGYDDTIAALKKYNVGFFGYDHKYITTIKGVKIGAVGYEGWENTANLRNQIKSDISYLHNQGAKIVIASFHWGVERSNYPNSTQVALGRFSIDNGASLVIGSHPHVVQGIEEYKGHYIVYSLGNFMFGGNRNPSDKDTFIFQQTFHIQQGNVTNQKDFKIIPVSISSVKDRNNYQPTLLQGAEAKRVLSRIKKYSGRFSLDWTAMR